ncbi:hypothetical protein GCM10011507_03000 [Edaphobacter acidisoli]|uniref:Organic solvent tolerance-like N-terminal domain-containing protein n=1 Tax=Edaphobacter acidisoli TaxID=2040573 RepID=A0A916VZA7_9BACT|nr:LptA/OstA family protein [Edaphobacter acidisoli]GGA55126.1 hypothetical protein GCM10011507_03000 [Edaphobacter acidisoli]
MAVSVSVERLRRWLLAGAVLLVAVIAAFLGYAHYRAHRFLTALPEKLGADIRQETNGFTYSQSEGGRTIYTLHASKAIQHKDGHYTLHDVGIVLYGRKGDRADRIYGSEFDYDQKNGVVRAMGEVHLDLQAPAAKDAKAKMDYAAGKDLAANDEIDSAHLIHVTTSGLVYMQKLGVAATDQPIEFEAGGMKGHAVGADYTSDSGVLILHSAVSVAGIERGRPAVLTAAHAELDRENQQVTLAGARYVTTDKTGVAQSAQAEHAIVHLRSDGTAQNVDANGAVTLKSVDGMVVAPRGKVTLNADNDPQLAVMTGGVTLGADGPLRKAQGRASEARLVFDRNGRPEQMLMTGAVSLHEQLRSSEAQIAWSERQLNAGEVKFALKTSPAGKTLVQDASATGSAALAMTNPAVKVVHAGKKSTGANATVSSALAGDALTARFTEVNGVQHLAEVRGDGHTSLRRVNAAGTVNTSSADSLVAIFKPVAAAEKPSAKGGFGTDEIASAVEQGHVVLTQTLTKAGTANAPEEERATAEQVSYDGGLERTTLTGNVQVDDAESTLWADRVVADQETGDATADGSVKVSYLAPKNAKGSASSEDPVHVLASHADLKHDSDVAMFYGAAGQRARLWQGASQVEAAVIQFDRKQKRMEAHGAGQGAPMAVRAVLTSSAKPSDKAKAGRPVKANVFEIRSRELVYSDEKHEADFAGGTEVTSADGRMRGQQAVVYLKQAGKTAPGAKGNVQSGFIGGSVERMVATGGIVVDQPGRRATGQQVVYTASDGMFRLTGTPSAPPEVIDDQRGTVTGTLLEFHAGDESVVVSNGGNGSAGRVRTQTQVKKLK